MIIPLLSIFSNLIVYFFWTLTRLTTNSLIFIPGDIHFIVHCGIGAYLRLVRWGDNRWCLENTKWGHFENSTILSNVGSYWSELEKALGVRIESIQASIIKDIQGHVKERQGRQKNYVDKSRRQSQLQMRQKVLRPNHTFSKATWGTQKEMKPNYPHSFAISVHIFTKFISFKDKTL